MRGEGGWQEGEGVRWRWRQESEGVMGSRVRGRDEVRSKNKLMGEISGDEA